MLRVWLLLSPVQTVDVNAIQTLLEKENIWMLKIFLTLIPRPKLQIVVMKISGFNHVVAS